MFFSCTVVSTVTFFKLPGFMVLLFSPALMVSISHFSLPDLPGRLRHLVMVTGCIGILC